MASTTLCPRFHKAIELVGSRWTGAILQMLMPGPARFSTLREAVGDISDRMLSERLQELEHEGLVSRTVLPDPPIRVEYELTPKGRELQSTLASVARWAEKWLPEEDPGTSGILRRVAVRSAPRPRKGLRPTGVKVRARSKA
jgi:DNA-binding HxlR family transcriptional regulator